MRLCRFQNSSSSGLLCGRFSGYQFINNQPEKVFSAFHRAPGFLKIPTKVGVAAQAARILPAKALEPAVFYRGQPVHSAAPGLGKTGQVKFHTTRVGDMYVMGCIHTGFLIGGCNCIQAMNTAQLVAGVAMCFFYKMQQPVDRVANISFFAAHCVVFAGSIKSGLVALKHSIGTKKYDLVPNRCVVNYALHVNREQY